MCDSSKVPLKKAKTTGQINVEKLERRNIQEQQRRIKPGLCLKYIRAVIDPEFLSGQPGSKVLSSLVDLGVKYQIRQQKTSKTISWERSEQQTLIASAENLAVSEKYSPENEVLLLMYGEEIVEAIKQNTLRATVLELKSNFQDVCITLLIFGLKNFCRKNSDSLKRVDIEKHLTELQILYNCNHRLQETADEIASTVAQFSKAIAEIPFKKQQSEKYSDANVFLQNDNKDCVRVEGSAGLSRLWQQHLTRLPLVTLETAEAIMDSYPRPKMLLEEYENNPEGANVLMDLKVRRAGGPLSSVRRIGPELSRKVHTLYTSLDPNEKL